MMILDGQEGVRAVILRKWEDMPDFMKNSSVRPYYESLSKKQMALFAKRAFDILTATALSAILAPVFIAVAVIIKIDSQGPVFFRQLRVTQFGKQFRILKFRTMVVNAEKIGTQITIKDDCRVTRLGKLLRKSHLDEIPQLFNIISGDMTFVGTRPEVVKYVAQYTDAMQATLLLPAGVTSMTSIEYKDEGRLLSSVVNAEEVYLNVILPEKMEYNLKSLSEYKLRTDFKIIAQTAFAVLRRAQSDKELKQKGTLYDQKESI